MILPLQGEGEPMGNDAARDAEERIRPLTEQWPSIRLLGLGAWWAWIWLSYNSTSIMRLFPSDRQPSLVLAMYLFSTLGIAACMIATALNWRTIAGLVGKRAFVIAFGSLGSIATVLLGFSFMMGEGAFFVLAALLTGIGTSALCVKVGQTYGNIALGDSLTAGGLSLVFAAFLYFTGIGIPEQWRLFFVAALPIASALMLTMAPSDPFPSATSCKEEDTKSAPVKRLYRNLVIGSALVALTAGIGKGVSSVLRDSAAFASEGSIVVFFVGLIGICIAAVVNSGDAVRGARRIYSALLVLGIAMMLGSCFGLSLGFLSVGKEALWLVLSCFMAYLAFRHGLSPVRIFGIGQGAYFLASAGGWAIGRSIAPYYSDSIVRMGVGMGLAFLVVVVMVYVLPENDIKRIMAWSVDGDLSPHRKPTVPNASVDPLGADAGVDVEAAEPGANPERPGFTMARAADPKYGLSARELEILDLFAQGRSANWIADNLTISKNTVRSHLRASYTKLDVHTRQELLDFLAGERP